MDPKSPPNLTQTTAIGGLNKKSPEPWRIEGVKLINGDVLVDPLLKSCDRLKRKSCRYDKDRSSKRRWLESGNDGVSGEFSHDGLFYKPWLDSLGEDKDLSSSYQSQDVLAALTLIQMSNGAHRSTKTQIQKEPEMHPKIDSCDCNICGKRFPSFHALGVHMTIHLVKPPQPILENGIRDVVEKTRRPKLPPSGKIHKCPICHIVFPTGQALGGHKRRHYKGEKHNHSEVILSTDGASGGDKSSQSNCSVVTKVLEKEERQRSLLWIDLNESPLPEIDETTVEPWLSLKME